MIINYNLYSWFLDDDFEGDGDDGGCHDEYCTDAAAQNVNQGCVIVKVMVSIAVI